MNHALLECVPNISAGRDVNVVDAIAQAITHTPQAFLLHRTSDVDHNRTVFTIAGSPAAVLDAAFAAVRESVRLIDLTQHSGIHPRLGALDVLPLIPIRGLTLAECVGFAHDLGERIWKGLGVPVYFYEAAARRLDRIKLEDVRRGQFEELRESALSDPNRSPDIGGPALHPTAGAVIVGARKFLIAFNINLKSKDIALARHIAAQIRERDGGLPGIKALGLSLASRGLVQVSLNVTDFERTSLLAVYRAVEALAAQYSVAIEESELIGMLPQAAFDTGWVEALKLNNFSDERILENQLAMIMARRQDL